VSVQKGSNLTRKVSQVKLSPLVQITHGHLAEHATPISPHALTLVPEADEATKLGFIDSVYPELKTYANIKELHQHFDASYVNVKSLLGYIKWLEKGATDLDKERRTRDITQATHIVNVASALDGIFLQKRKVSPFGRTYYEGISAQSVRKSLRQAMFGGCWEYDIRSAVISWKVGMGSTLLAEVTTAGQSPRSVQEQHLLHREQSFYPRRDLLGHVYKRRTRFRTKSRSGWSSRPSRRSVSGHAREPRAG